MWIINLIPAWDRDNFVLRIWNHYERCDLIEKLAISTFARASCSLLLNAERFLSTRLNNLIVSFGENFFIVENFNAQINSVFECVTCNRGPYLQITVYSSIFGSLTKINWSKQTLKLSVLQNIYVSQSYQGKKKNNRDLSIYFADQAYANPDKSPWPFDSHAEVARVSKYWQASSLILSIFSRSNGFLFATTRTLHILH